jgi:DNA modification methylase
MKKSAIRNNMKTEHKVYNASATIMKEIQNESISLIITSPPYPMIVMWDDCFRNQKVNIFMEDEYRVDQTFIAMHMILNDVWKESFRVLIPGGFLCINIGDATRTINGTFRLFSNHSRILQNCLSIGFQNLPNIIWRKQTNAPNKFMGSGMLPGGAYVTLEHEYILIFRKPGKRQFKTDLDKKLRKQSAYFWEERNIWFSDIWDFKGTTQGLNGNAGRERSGAFPIELPHRLINMYSLHGDTVLDPFLGTGTSTLAAMMNGRNSVGYDIDPSFLNILESRVSGAFIKEANRITYDRIMNHSQFIEDYIKKGKQPKHLNANYNFPVITNQETDIKLYGISDITREQNMSYMVTYTEPDVNQQSLLF